MSIARHPLIMFGTKPAAAPSGYLLDTYTGAAAAYSLRQLKTGVTSVVRVRRSSDSAEADFTATEITNGTLTTWTGANDGFVTIWYDQASSYNLTQTTASSQPSLVTAGVVNTLNGDPIIQFIADKTLLGFGGAGGYSEYSLFGLMKIDTTGNFRGFGRIDNSNYYLLTGSPFNNLLIRHQGDFISGGYFADASEAIDFLFSSVRTSGFSISVYRNGTLKFTEALANTTLANHLLGNIGDTEIKELVLFPTDESANRTGIETNINTHYGIY